MCVLQLECVCDICDVIYRVRTNCMCQSCIVIFDWNVHLMNYHHKNNNKILKPQIVLSSESVLNNVSYLPCFLSLVCNFNVLNAALHFKPTHMRGWERERAGGNGDKQEIVWRMW